MSSTTATDGTSVKVNSLNILLFKIPQIVWLHRLRLPPALLLLLSSFCPPALFLDFQYQVISLQGSVGCDMDRLNCPGQRGVDHRLHLHGRENTQWLTLLHLGWAWRVHRALRTWVRGHWTGILGLNKGFSLWGEGLIVDVWTCLPAPSPTTNLWTTPCPLTTTPVSVSAPYYPSPPLHRVFAAQSKKWIDSPLSQLPLWPPALFQAWAPPPDPWWTSEPWGGTSFPGRRNNRECLLSSYPVGNSLV